MGAPIGDLEPLREQVVKARLCGNGISHAETGMALDDLVSARSHDGAAGTTFSQRIGAVDAVKALELDPVDQRLALLVSHHEFVPLLKKYCRRVASIQPH